MLQTEWEQLHFLTSEAYLHAFYDPAAGFSVKAVLTGTQFLLGILGTAALL